MTSAYTLIPPTSALPLFIFGDHASKHIPSVYDDLGLAGDDLSRHIAWDIGTETIIRRLCDIYECGGLVAGVSRLVIDLNRAPHAQGLIPSESDGTVISANQNVTDSERTSRMELYYTPYHRELGRVLDTLPHPFIISMHSFTDHPLTGYARKTDIGLLTRHDEASAELFRNRLMTMRPDYKVEINQPYSAYDLNYTIDEHVAPRGLRHLAIEVKQSHIETRQKATYMADFLADAMRPLLNLRD